MTNPVVFWAVPVSSDVPSASAKSKPPVPPAQQGRIIQHAWHLKKNCYRESTIVVVIVIAFAVTIAVGMITLVAVGTAIGFGSAFVFAPTL